MRPFSLSRLCLGAALCGCLLAPSVVRADAFSPIPTGNPIYRQLDAIALMGDGKPLKPASNLTRYEAALQVARVAVIATGKPNALSRSGWRSLRDLTVSLKSELRQLGVNVEDVLAACSRQLDASAKPLLPAPAPPRSLKSGSNTAPSMLSLLGSASSPASLNSGLSSSQNDLDLPILGGKARVAAAVSALRRDTQDPLFTPGGTLGIRSNATQITGKNLSLTVGVTPWLRLRGLSSQQKLGVGTGTPLSQSSPLFSGAHEATGFGGGIEVSPGGGLSFSTIVERLSTDAGASGTRYGGGIGLSAWQNRLTIAAHLSRLQPEDRAMLGSTETELNLGVGVSQRLSLNVLYQGLFSSQSESSRLAGGLNFSF